MSIHTAAVPPFYKNGFVVSCETTRDSVIIDPGDEVGALLSAVASEHLVVKAILLTHAHLDHVTGVGAARAATGAPIWLHRDDLFLYDGVVRQAQMFGLDAEPQPPIDCFYEPDTTIEFGRQVVTVHHTPGHCPGGVCLAIRSADDAGTLPDLFVGDTLFAGSIGRTDLPGGDHDTLLRSIREVLFAFPDACRVLSGHGPVTTIGEERRSNPFLVDASG